MAEFDRNQLATSIRFIHLHLYGRVQVPVALGALFSSQAIAAGHDIQADSVFTNVTTTGSVHEITSKKISGTNAINVFDKFVVGNSNTVNLQVPTNASKLVNIVRGSAAPEVHGILNSYKDGTLGGDVVFASSQGFVVGKTGIVNVGGLSVKTPQQSGIDALISGGEPVATTITNLLNNSFSVSPSGTVRISGKVNTASGVDIHANTIEVDKDAIVISGNAAAATGVSNYGVNNDYTAVNLDDLTIPTELRQDGGTIVLRAASTADNAIDLSGDLYADGGFTITADKITVNSGALLDTRDAGDLSSSGTIQLLADGNDTAALTLNASGNKVLLEASSASTPEINASGITLVGAVTADGSVNVTADTFQSNSNSSLDFAGSVTITADSRASVSGTLAAESGISINSKDIDLDSGSLLDTRNSGDTARGDVILTASVSEDAGLGAVSAATNIDFGGQVYAGNLTARAESKAASSIKEEPGAALGSVVGGVFAGASFFFMDADAEATVNVNGTANLNASGNVSLTTESHAISDASAITLGSALPGALAAVYATSDATSTTHVKSGATIQAGGNLEVTAHNESYVSAMAFNAIAENANKVVIAAAVGEADVDATAKIDSGVTLDANNLVVAAENQNYYYVSASAYGFKATQYGFAVAVGDFDTNATAELGSSLGTDQDKTGNVAITALDRTLNQRVHSGVTVGSNLFMRTIGSNAVAGLSAFQNGVHSYTNQYLPGGHSEATSETNKVGFKGGLAFSLNLSDHDAYSYLGTNVPGQADAPHIKATGNILVASQTDLGSDNEPVAGGNSNGALGDDQGGYRTSAETAVSSPSQNSGSSNQTPSSEKSLALALNLAINDSDAVAEVGRSVQIDAANLGVVAAQHMPIVSTYDKWDTFSDVVGKFNGVGGLQSNLLTSFANAGAAADKEAYGGSFNVIWNDMDTKAWIGNKAKVTTTGTGNWSATRVVKANSQVPGFFTKSKVFKDITYSFDFSESVAVKAYNLMETATVAGNLGTLGIMPNGNGTNEKGKSIGGSISYIQQSGSAVAGIGKATVNASGHVGIVAKTDERHFLVTPSSGQGSGVGFNGVLGFLNSEVLSHASLHNQAQLSADNLVIIADHEFGNWAAAGAFNWSDQSAVGIAIAANVSQGDTKAFIGDNSSEYNKVKFEDKDNNKTDRPEPSAPTAPTPTKGIVVNSVAVRGRATGTNGSLAVAGAVTTEPTGEPGVGTKLESWYNGLSSKVAANYTGANGSNSDSSIGQSSQSGQNGSGNDSGNSSAEVASDQTGLTGAGSFTVSVNNIDAKAMIDGAVISGHSNGSSYNDVDVTVQALEKVISASATGSAALSLLGAQSPANQTTIAGAISYQISFNDALAWITNSTIAYADDVSVQALHGGELTSVALALSITSPAQTSVLTKSGALSISGAQIYDGTSARIQGSSISSNQGANNDLEVSAYNNSYVGVGGGSLYGGGKQGAGLAITFAEINDPSAIPGDANPDGNNVLSTAYNEDVYNGAATEAIVDYSGNVRSYLNNFDRIDISARSLNRIVIGAAGIGYNNNLDNSLGFLGSFAIGSIGADTKTLVKGTNISGAGIVNVNASGEKDSNLDTILSDLGSSATNSDFDFSGAAAMDNTNVHTTEDGSGSTYNYSSEGKRIIAVAGVVQAGKKNLGISYAHADVKSKTRARIEDTNINQSDSAAEVNVNARDNSLLYSVAIGVGVGTGGFSGVGSVAVNRLNNQVVAEIGDWNGPDKGMINASSLSVTARNDMDMINVAGAVAIASGQGGATAGGLAVALNLVGTDEHSTKARVSNTNLKVDSNLSVRALSGTSGDKNLLVGNAIAVGASLGQSGIGFAGAISTNNVDQSIAAGIKDTATNRSSDADSSNGGDVIVQGQDYTDSVATAWMGAGSGQGSAFGVAVATNRVDSDVTAEILGNDSNPGSTTLRAKNVLVDAHRRNWLLTIDAGVAASKQVSFAPSIGTGIIDGDVTARIAQDAKVEAWNNVVVEASARSVNLVGSGALGIGIDGGAGALAVSTAVEYGRTDAYIDDAVIVAKGLGGSYSAGSGQLASNSGLPDLSTAGEGSNDSVSIDDLTTGFASHSMQEGTESASGLVVSATSYQKQRAITVGGSGSKNVALTANVSTTSVDSSTSAYISNASINQGYATTAEADVLVRGSNHSFGLSVAAGGSVTVGGESGAAGIGGFSTNRESKDTTAKIENSNVNANEVEIDARATKIAQAVSAGIAAALGSTSGIGGAASVVITEQNGNTTSWLRGGVVTTDALAVNAETRQEANVAAGAAGIGTSVGIGVGLAVNLVGGNTRARIGKDDGNSNDNIITVVNADDVDVDASRLESVNSYAFGAGIGASGTGVAAMVNTTEITGETRAGIYGKYASNNWTTRVRGKDGSSKATSVDVNSQEILYANQVTAGIGVGATVGVGAVANVLLGRSQAYSEIVGSGVKGTTINVESNTLRETDLVSVSGAGGQYSAAVSIGLVLMGQGDSTTDDGVNAEDEFGDSRDMANNALAVDYDSSNPHLGSDDTANMGGGGSVATSSSSPDSNAVYTVSGSRLKLTGESVTAARISGGDIDAGTLTVSSNARLHTYQGVGAAQGSAVGVAGGIGVTRLYDMSIATVDGDITADNITVAALARNKSDEAAAGEMKNFIIGVGGTAIGVSYSDVRSRHRVVAGLSQAVSSDTTNDGGTLSVSAKDTTEIRIGDTGSDVSSNPGDGTLNVNIGAGAIGVSVGIAEKDSDVDAWLGTYDDNGTSVTSDDKHSLTDGFVSQSVEAEVSGGVRATAFAAAGGLLAGVQGVVTDARDKSNADAVVYGQLGSGSGSLKVKATAAPEVFSRAYGVTVSAIAAVGGSFSYASADTTANAEIADRTRLSENSNVTVEAVTGKPGADYVSANAAAFAASGGGLVSATGAEAVASNNSDTTARVGDYVQLPTGDLVVTASNLSRQIADADGYFVGYYSAGLTFSTAKSLTSTRVLFGKDPVGPGSRSGDIILLANSIDENQGFSTAGGGGYVSGSATVSNSHTKDSDDKESASVEVADWSNNYTSKPVGAGKIQMEAHHQTRFFAGADSINVSVLGGSGARSDVEVDLDTSVDLGQNVSFYADEIDFSTSNNVDQITNAWYSSFGHSVKAGAGGAINGSAALSDIDISHLGATVDLGENVVLKLDPMADVLDPEHNLMDYHIQMDAFTTYNLNDVVVLEVGGALQGAGAESSINVDAVNTVNIGRGVTIINPVGQVEMGAYSRGFATADASSTIWAAAGVAGGVTDVDLNTRNAINIYDNVEIESFQSTKILAGRSADYITENYLSANARTNVYNWTLIPIPATKTAAANVTVNNTVTFGNNVDVASVRDILLEANRGQSLASGDGVERNPYLELFSSETKFGSGNAGHGTAKIIFNGTTNLEAGSRYLQTVIVNADGSITLGNGTEAVAYNYGSFSSRASLESYINELKAERQALENQTGGVTDGQGGVSEGGGSGGGNSTNEALDKPARITQIEEELAFLEPLLDTLPQTSNDAVYIGGLYAAGGDVSLKADEVEVTSGTPTITAHGDPTITINNVSGKSLIIGDMYIPNVGGGSVLVSGAVAGKLPAGLTVVEGNSGSGSHINIQHKPSVTTGADVVLQGNLSNLGGIVTVNVEKGNLIQTGSISAKQMALSVPSGVYLLNNQWQDQTYGFDPQSLTGFTSQWKPATPDELVMYYVNARYQNEMSSKGEEDFNQWWYGNDYYGNNQERDGHLRVYLNWGFNNNAECKGGSDCEIFYFDNNAGGNSRGNGNWGFDQIKNLQNNLVRTASYQQVKNAGYGDRGGYALEAQLVAVNAYRIDINGTIRAGNFNEWSVSVGNNFASAVAQYAAARGLSSGSIIKLSPGQKLSWQEANPNYGKGFDFRRYITRTVDPQVSLVNGGDAGISISYEVGSGKITLDDVNASGNGFVSLRGRLMSTGADGKILVDDGRGSIDVINRSTSELVINDLNAGSQSTGVIRITDLNYRDHNNRYFSEWYVHEPGQQIQKYTTSASATSYTSATGTTVGYSDGGKQTYIYQPKKGQLYYFVQREEVKRSINWKMDGEYISGWFSTYQPLSDWKYDADNPNKAEWNIAYDGFTTCASVSFVGCGTDGTVSTYLTHVMDDYYMNQTWLYPYTTSYSNYYGGDFTKIKWNIYVPYYMAMKSTTYVKADHPIKFQFIGADTGSINVQSRTGVTLTGNINNSAGTTRLTVNRNLGSGGVLRDTGSILMSNTGILNSGKTYLSAVGSLGSSLQSLNIITDHISAVANGGSVNLDLTAASGAIAVEKLHANSTLNATVDKGLTPYGSGLHLKGDDINLVSDFGGIGDVSGNKVMNLSSSGLVTMQATGDIALNQASGNMTINTIESGAGDILVTLGNGHLVNGIGQDRYTDEELAYQAEVWDRLNLRSDDAGRGTVTAYENQVSGQYHNYWLIRQRLDDDSEGNFTINADYLSAFKTRYKSYQDATNGTDLDIDSISVAEVTNALEVEYRAISDWIAQEKATGKLDSSYNFGNSYNTGYHFTIADNSRLYQTLTEGARWSDSQLEISISSAALQPVTDGYISSRAANISGNNVILKLTNGRVGEDLADMQFAIDKSNPNLSDTQKAALLEAGPGDLAITDGSNSIVVRVRQQDPIKLNADGEVTLVANQQIYVESDQGLTLKQVSTSGDVRMAAGGAIESASGNSTTITANNLNLSTSTGHIGTETGRISMSLAGALRSVASPSDIWLDHVGDNLQLGAIGAGGLLNLRANGNIQNWSANNDNVHILANGAVISARSGSSRYNIGQSGRALKMRLSGGDLELEGGKGWVEANSTSLVDIAAVNLSGHLDFDSASRVDLSGNFITGSLDMDVEGDISARQLMNLASSGDLNILANTLGLQKATVSGDTVYLEADTGAATLGAVSSTSGAMSLLASGDMNLHGSINAKNALVLTAQGLNMNNGSSIQAQSTANLTTVADMALETLSSAGNLRLRGNNITVNNNITGTGSSSFDIDAGALFKVVAGKSVKAAGHLDLDAGVVNMLGNSLVSSGQALTIDTQSGAMTLGNTAGNTVTYKSAGDLISNGQIDVDTTATLTSKGNTHLKAMAVAGNDFTISADGNITLDGNLASGQGSIILRGQKALYANRRIQARKDVDIELVESLNLSTSQVLASGEQTTLKTASINMAVGSLLDVEGDLEITTPGNQVLAGIDVEGILDIESTGSDIRLNDNVYVNQNAFVDADNGNVTLASGKTVATESSLRVESGSLTLEQGSSLDSAGVMTLINNSMSMATSSVLESLDDITVTTANAATLNQLQGSKVVNVTSDGALVVNSSISAGDYLSLRSENASVTLNGDVTAHNNITLGSKGLTTLNGLVTSNTGSFTFMGENGLAINEGLNISAVVDIDALDAVTLAEGKTLYSGANTRIDSRSVVFGENSVLDVDGSLNLATGEQIELFKVDAAGAATLISGTDLTVNDRLDARSLNLDNDGTTHLKGITDVTIGLVAEVDGNFVADGAVTVGNKADLAVAGDITFNSTLTSSQGSLTVKAGDDLVFNDDVTINDTVDLTVADHVTLAAGKKLYSGASTTVNSASLGMGDAATLEIAGNTTLATSGDQSLATLIAGGSLDSDSTAGSVAFRENATVTGIITVDAANAVTLAANRTMMSGQNTTINADSVNFADGSTLAVDSAFSLTTINNAGLFNVDVAGTADITTGTGLTVNDQLITGNNLIVNAGGAALFNAQVTAGGAITGNIGESLLAQQAVTAAEDIVLDVGGSATFNSVLSSTNAGIQLTGRDALTLNDDVVAAENIEFTVAESITLAVSKTIRSGEDLSITGRSLSMGGSSRLEVSNNLVIETGENQELATINVGNDFNTTSVTGAIRFNESVDVTGNMSVQANREVTLAAQQAINAGSLAIGTLQATGADRFSMGANAGITTSGQTLIHTSGDQLIGQLTSDSADQAFFLKTSAGAINGRGDLDIVGAERHLRANQRVGCDTDGRNCSGAQAVLQAATGIGDPLVVDLPWLSAETDEGDINILASSDLHARLLRVTNGNIYMTALGYLEIEELIGTPWLLVNDFLFADRMTLARGGISSRESVQINNITMTDSGPLAIYAPSIDVNIDGGGANETLMAMGGFNEPLSLTSDAGSYYQNLENNNFVPALDTNDVVVNLVNSDQLHITSLLAKGGTMRMTGDLLVDSATVTTKEGYNWSLTTNAGAETELTLDLNNSNGGAVDVDGQFMTPFGEFWMAVEGITVTTNAQFTRYRTPLLLTYKGQQDDPQVAGLPESFYRLSVEYLNDINAQEISSNSGIPVGQQEDPEQLVTVSDDWLSNLPATAAGADNSDNDDNNNEYWLITSSDDEGGES